MAAALCADWPTRLIESWKLSKRSFCEVSSWVASIELIPAGEVSKYLPSDEGEKGLFLGWAPRDGVLASEAGEFSITRKGLLGLADRGGEVGGVGASGTLRGGASGVLTVEPMVLVYSQPSFESKARRILMRRPCYPEDESLLSRRNGKGAVLKLGKISKKLTGYT